MRLFTYRVQLLCVVLLGFFCVSVGFSEWGTNDISGYSLILSGQFKPFLETTPYLSPLLMVTFESLGTGFGSFSLQSLFLAPWLLFLGHAIVYRNSTETGADKLGQVRNVSVLLFTIPMFLILLHEMHVIICSALLFSFIIRDFAFNETHKPLLSLSFALLIMFVALGIRASAEIYFLGFSVFLTSMLIVFEKLFSQDNHIISLKNISGTCVALIIGAVVSLNLHASLGEDFYAEKIGVDFKEKNAARHFVQVTSKIPQSEKAKLLGLEEHELGLLNFNALPAEKYTGAFFAQAREILEENQNTADIAKHNLASVLSLSGKKTTLILFIFGLALCVWQRHWLHGGFLLLALASPFIIGLVISFLFRVPPLRVWIPIYVVHAILFYYFVLVILASNQLVSFAKSFPSDAKMRDQNLMINFSIVSKLVNLKLFLSSHIFAFSLDRLSLTAMVRAKYGGVFVTFLFMLSVSLIGIIQQYDFYNTVLTKSCSAHDRIYEQIKADKAMFTFDGLYFSPCLLRPYGKSAFDGRNILILGGTSFITKSQSEKFNQAGGIEGLMCDLGYVFPMMEATANRLSRLYPELHAKLTYEEIIVEPEMTFTIARCLET